MRLLAVRSGALDDSKPLVGFLYCLYGHGGLDVGVGGHGEASEAGRG